MKTINRIICSLLLASACSIGAIAQENQSYFLHTIEKGQSLYSIASMYGVSQSDIIKLNPGSDEKIFIGRTLRIPRSAANIQKETYHTIETGETLYRLTVKYNVSAKAICDANPGLSAENFRIGQVIRIPSTTEPQTMVPVETQSSTVVANNNILGPVESRCRDMHKVCLLYTSIVAVIAATVGYLNQSANDDFIANAGKPFFPGKLLQVGCKDCCLLYTSFSAVGGTHSIPDFDLFLYSHSVSYTHLELKRIFPRALIIGHHDLNPVKACPYFDAEREYRGL